MRIAKEFQADLRKLLEHFDAPDGPNILVFDVSDETVDQKFCKKALVRVFGGEFLPFSKFRTNNVHEKPFLLEENKIKSRKVDLQTFLGPYFDLKKKRLVGTEYFAGTHTTEPGFYTGVGYVSAFTNGVVFSQNEEKKKAIRELFMKMNKKVLNGFEGESLEIYQWSTDWNDFFGEGSFMDLLWTVHNKKRKLLMVVAVTWAD